jgi:hypothetical protein
MRAVICRAWGEPEGLAVEHVAPPTPGRGEVVIDVEGGGQSRATAVPSLIRELRHLIDSSE